MSPNQPTLPSHLCWEWKDTPVALSKVDTDLILDDERSLFRCKVIFFAFGFQTGSNHVLEINLFFSPTSEDSLLASPLSPPGLGWFVMPGSELVQKLPQEKMIPDRWLQRHAVGLPNAYASLERDFNQMWTVMGAAVPLCWYDCKMSFLPPLATDDLSLWCLKRSCRMFAPCMHLTSSSPVPLFMQVAPSSPTFLSSVSVPS